MHEVDHAVNYRWVNVLTIFLFTLGTLHWQKWWIMSTLLEWAKLKCHIVAGAASSQRPALSSKQIFRNAVTIHDVG